MLRRPGWLAALLVSIASASLTLTASAVAVTSPEQEELVAAYAPHLMLREQTDQDNCNTSEEQYSPPTTVDTVLGGQEIKAGDKVVIYYASANFDEDVFEDPNTFDIHRTPNDHVTFGPGGPHFCLGAHLARLETRVLFQELLPRLASIEPAGQVERIRSNFVNGIKRMPVRITTR